MLFLTFRINDYLCIEKTRLIVRCHSTIHLLNPFLFRSWESIDVNHWWIRCWQDRKYQESHSIFCFGRSCWCQKGRCWQGIFYSKKKKSILFFLSMKIENNDSWRSNYFSQWIFSNEFISIYLLFLIRSGLGSVW